MAEINKYKFKDGDDTIIVTHGPYVHESTRNGEPFGRMDLEHPTPETAAAYYQGMADKMVIDKNFQRTDSQGNPVFQTNPESYDNYPNMDQTTQQGMGNQQTAAKVKTLSNGHSILGNDQYPNGFTDRLLISILGGLGLGVIAAATYIFINLSKVSISLS